MIVMLQQPSLLGIVTVSLCLNALVMDLCFYTAPTQPITFESGLFMP